MIAYVYFWDGYRFGARVVTEAEGLEARLVRAIEDEHGVGRVTAKFVAFDLAEGVDAQVWPPAPARTAGQYVAVAESEGNWPPLMGDGNFQAGVFVVDIMSGDCRITGGMGFSDADCNPRALREVQLPMQGDDDAD